MPYICLGLWERNPKQIHQHGPNFRSGNSEIVILDRSSLCQASHLVSIVAICRAIYPTFLHLFLVQSSCL